MTMIGLARSRFIPMTTNCMPPIPAITTMTITTMKVMAMNFVAMKVMSTSMITTTRTTSMITMMLDGGEPAAAVARCRSRLLRRHRALPTATKSTPMTMVLMMEHAHENEADADDAAHAENGGGEQAEHVEREAAIRSFRTGGYGAGRRSRR